MPLNYAINFIIINVVFITLDRKYDISYNYVISDTAAIKWNETLAFPQELYRAT